MKMTKHTSFFRLVSFHLALGCTALPFFAGVISARGDPEAPASTVSPETYGIWITGTVLSRDGILLFECDKPVQGNKTGKVVMLGTTTEAAPTFLPAFVNAANKHMKLRLFGILLPAPSGKPLGEHKNPIPNVQFRVWKAHLPNEPDVLPPSQKVTVP
jgi:hypothetical protein